MSVTLQHLVDVSRARCEAARRAVPEAELRAQVTAASIIDRPTGRLRGALEGEAMSVIAEVKGASPVAGRLREPFEPLEVATAYAAAGASAVSVLTEERYFAGSLDHLRAIAGALDLPTLRKDFIVEEYQVLEAALAGAGAVLLIAEVMEPARLRTLVGLAHELRLDALVEAHDEASIDAALAAGSGLIGINNRDLSTMRVDWRHALRVAAAVPADVIAVAESGIDSPEQLARLAEAGYSGALVGTSLVRADDPGAALRRLLAGEPTRRSDVADPDEVLHGTKGNE